MGDALNGWLQAGGQLSPLPSQGRLSLPPTSGRQPGLRHRGRFRLSARADSAGRGDGRIRCDKSRAHAAKMVRRLPPRLGEIWEFLEGG